MSRAFPTVDWCQEIDKLVQAWCDRRELGALRQILGAWPILNGLTDEWGNLAQSLHSIAGFRDLPDQERQAVKRLYVEIDHMMRSR